MDITGLDAFSQSVAEKIFARFPEWKALAMAQAERDAPSYLLVEVPPPPQADVAEPLRITTSNEEVTVGFDYYHCHFDEWVSDDGDSFGEGAALKFVEALLSERQAAASWWHGNDWRGSTVVRGSERPKPPDFVRDARRVRIRSWLGTYNADYAA